jgi:hypothetical protein
MLTGSKKKGPISVGVVGRAQKYGGVPRFFRPKPARAELLDGPVEMTCFRPLSSAKPVFVQCAQNYSGRVA